MKRHFLVNEKLTFNEAQNAVFETVHKIKAVVSYVLSDASDGVVSNSNDMLCHALWLIASCLDDIEALQNHIAHKVNVAISGQDEQ